MQACHRHTPAHWESMTGVMRCLASIGDWEQLLATCREEWSHADMVKRQEMSALAAHAAWHMSEWKSMAKFVDAMETSSGRDSASSTGSILRAVLAIQRGKPAGNFVNALDHIQRTRCAPMHICCTRYPARRNAAVSL